MIFITIGTQLPFDRLIQGMDEWCALNPAIEVFAQIGCGDYQPKNMNFKKNVAPSEFDSYMRKSSLIVSHAGMGTIISSLLSEKPIIVLARDADRGEHRNQHQIATAKKFEGVDGCYSCYEVKELAELLSHKEELNAGKANKKNIELANLINEKMMKLISV